MQTSADLTRSDEVHDPRLSDAANDALTREVRAVLDADEAHGGATGASWRPSRGTPRTHVRLLSAVNDARILVVPVVLMFAVIALIATVGDTYPLIALAFAGLVIGVVLVAELIAQMTREVEHVSPETAALLEAEGITRPDHLFGDLLATRRDEHRTSAHA